MCFPLRAPLPIQLEALFFSRKISGKPASQPALASLLFTCLHPFIQTDILKASSGYLFSGALWIQTALPSRLSERISTSRKSHLESLDSSFVRSLWISQFTRRDTHTFQSETQPQLDNLLQHTANTLLLIFFSFLCLTNGSQFSTLLQYLTPRPRKAAEVYTCNSSVLQRKRMVTLYCKQQPWKIPNNFS